MTLPRSTLSEDSLCRDSDFLRLRGLADLGLGKICLLRNQQAMTIQRNGLKKRRGIFFTPPAVSTTLATWAIRSPLERVLEPSFGDCGFLTALQKRFSAIGSEQPWQQIYGCDIGSTAFDRYLGPW